MNDEFIKMLKYLKLRGLSENWKNYLDIAQKSNFSHGRLLKYVIEEEYKNKKENSKRLRFNRAQMSLISINDGQFFRIQKGTIEETPYM